MVLHGLFWADDEFYVVTPIPLPLSPTSGERGEEAEHA